MDDYRFNRHSHVCPLCREPKDEGLIVCWACYRKHNFRHGESAEIKALLDAAEAKLAAAQ